jgi:hypothetical protein
MLWHKIKNSMLLHHAICGTANYKEQGASYFKGVYKGRRRRGCAMGLRTSANYETWVVNRISSR